MATIRSLWDQQVEPKKPIFIRRPCWHEGTFMEVVTVRGHDVLAFITRQPAPGRLPKAEPCTTYKAEGYGESDWIMFMPKAPTRKIKLTQCLFKSFGYRRSPEYFESEEMARMQYGDTFVKMLPSTTTTVEEPIE